MRLGLGARVPGSRGTPETRSEPGCAEPAKEKVGSTEPSVVMGKVQLQEG